MSRKQHGFLSPWLAATVIAAVALASGGLVVGLPDGSDSDPDSEEGPPPRPDPDLVEALLRSGLDADALAAAGVTADADATEVVDDVKAHLVTGLTDLRDADSDYATQRNLVDSLRRKVRSGLASQEEITQLATAKTDLATATSDRETALDAIFDAGTADLSQSSTDLLETIRGNRHWKLPLEFLTGDRTEQEWVDLRDALADERISANFEGEEVSAGSASLLSTCRAVQCVSTARSNLDTHCGHIQAAWDSACVEE